MYPDPHTSTLHKIIIGHTECKRKCFVRLLWREFSFNCRLRKWRSWEHY